MKALRKIFVILGLFFIAIFYVYSQENSKALLVIDIQDFYFKGGSMELHEPEKASANAALLIGFFRQENLPVIFIQHKTPVGMDIHKSVSSLSGEKVFIKTEINSFNGTGLKDYLDSLKIQELVICGMQTQMCVEAATRAAYDFGYKVELISDACTTRDLTWEDQVIEWDKVHNSTLVTLTRYALIKTTSAFLGESKQQ